MSKGISFPCQNCGHAVIVSKSKMISADDDSTFATCSKCGQNSHTMMSFLALSRSWNGCSKRFPALPDEPVTAPYEGKDAEPQIYWFPLGSLHSDWQERVQKQPYGDERPRPSPQPHLIDPPCPIDGTHRNEKPEHNVEAIGMSAEGCAEQQNSPERSESYFP